MTYFREMPSGDLLADPGGLFPEVPSGYVRDEAEPYRLHLEVKPGLCVHRTVGACTRGTQSRWTCNRDGKLPVNPGVCCRCQKLIEPFSPLAKV